MEFYNYLLTRYSLILYKMVKKKKKKKKKNGTEVLEQKDV